MFRSLEPRSSTSRSTTSDSPSRSSTIASTSLATSDQTSSGADRPRSGLIKISAAGLLWGTTGVVVQLLHQGTTLSPVGIGFYRLAIAALALLAVRRPAVLLAALRTAPLGLVLTGIGLGVYQALYFVAVTLGGVSIATVVSLGLAPVLLAGWETVRSAGGRHRPDRTTSVTVLGGVLGLVLITASTGQPVEGAPHPMLGLLAAIGCGLCYAASTVISRRQAQRIDAMTLTTVSAGIGALTLLPLAVIGGTAGIAVPLRSVPLLMLIYLGLVTTVAAYGLFYAGLRTTVGSTATVLTYLEPLAAAVLAVLVLGESLSLSALFGGSLLMAAIAIRYRW